MTSVTDILRRSVVVFSKNYLPVSRVNIKRAIALLVTGKAEPLEFNSGNAILVHSPNMVLTVPEHIRLTKTDTERVWKVPPVNRREVLRRDKHACQYCGSTKKLTLDHVIPRSKSGPHAWDNVVTACEQCNSRKGDRTPDEAGMTLRTKPKAPIHPAVAFAEQFWRSQVHAE
ncbi:MAG TPA: HNH endonuclease [Cyanobacteria bacterium UBA11149]|nr:HNH endonuclease [Cyanobacteria bacterium UBA11366]HBK66860.1 HNH endonuclease [Cyanobacteria bacterium UBA11166]HBW89254.1 HNH endonuclease [Cyanobacteria bacterium UBA11149]HCA97827.1 HNH endonuclease [Cyanobacteria bacterium UBA9226]